MDRCDGNRFRKDVVLLSELDAASLSCEPAGNMVVDVGGGTT